MPSHQPQVEPFVMVIFGGTGDLARRKLFPALYGLFRDKKLHERFAVIGVGRRPITMDEFRDTVRKAIDEHSRLEREEAGWADFVARFYYQPLNVKDVSAYAQLGALMERLENEWNLPGNRLFYLAMAPDLFGTVSMNLKVSGLTETNGWKRLIIEKPFGHDYASAKELNDQIRQTFAEEEIYRIDHYLGKEMIQNIEVIRFANSLFEPLWNNRYIDNIQITASETVGVEERAAYYDKAGALRDMVQNHILQMIMMVAMEPPSRLVPEAIHDEKVKVLRSLRRLAEEEVNQYMVRGQYQAGVLDGRAVPGYREEENVDPHSLTETFVAGELYVDNFRWSGVPFYIRTGKRMAQKSTEIVIQFKEMPKNLYFNKNGDLGPNLLVISINPVEGLHFVLNAKKPGADNEVVPIAMAFCNDRGGSPEAYERLIGDAIEGDKTFFTHWDEVSLAWKFVDPIRRVWDLQDESTLHPYRAGTWGPDAAHQLLSRRGAHWWPSRIQGTLPVVQGNRAIEIVTCK
ncbi:glucose-6-phosphate dehydrogenase [Polycladomyces subterraneus]|uniref:Glucose-6-phosphate 1-dehydrogenase n=1 Tax=Polycladomyces subterraneus TaxID=1016997 RepID=A0ABT8INI1_9BACL|nr:glucose-6-phosphate dehydrogenase [Polycladomyces subterraneus]MDN4594334.1 glucose-6-phosphate dehydrogenase [Polycladomyces subterraneus]